MAFNMASALAQDAKDLIAEEEATLKKEKQEAIRARRASMGAISTTNQSQSPISMSPDGRPRSPETPVETAETFAHRKKASEDTTSKTRASTSAFSGGKIKFADNVATTGSRRLPGDLGPNDPRRAASPPASKSQSPRRRRASGGISDTPPKMGRPRGLSDGALLRPKKKRESTDGKDRLPTDKDSESSSSDAESMGDSDEDDDDNSRRGRYRSRNYRDSPIDNRNSLDHDDDDDDDEDDDEDDDSSNDDENLQSSNREDNDSDDQQEEGHNRYKQTPPYSPRITVTPPSSNPDALSSRKKSVHPHSAYDHSARSTPRNSDDEEHMKDLRRAQKLSLTISPIHSTPSAHRVIRQIIRGDYGHFQREAEQGRRRQRVYLVATDLSPEAEYALEWTIGTVLRDGDTLLALYAVDEESSSSSTAAMGTYQPSSEIITSTGGSGGSDGVEIGHGADVVRDTASIVGALPPGERMLQPSSGSQQSRLGGAGQIYRDASATGNKSSTNVAESVVGGGVKTRAEAQRCTAAEAISDRVIRLLRKTRLQVRVVVEVFHCKSPRHMITEVVSPFLFPQNPTAPLCNTTPLCIKVRLIDDVVD